MARILVIEDEALVRFALCDTISGLGHEIIEATNGSEGMDVLNKEPVDIVITDIIMPVKEGIETTIEIRRAFPSIKIIAISGGGRAKNMQYLNIAQQYGAHYILKKPFKNKELTSILDECLAA